MFPLKICFAITTKINRKVDATKAIIILSAILMVSIRQTLENPWNIKVDRGFLSLKILPKPFGIAHSGMFSFLCMHENFFEIRTALRKKKIQYSEIEKVEFLNTQWYKNNFTFYPNNSYFRYSIRISFKEDVEKLCNFLKKKGINVIQNLRGNCEKLENFSSDN